MIVIIPFLTFVILIAVIVAWNNYKLKQRKAAARKTSAPNAAGQQQPTQVIRSVSSIVTSPSTGNIQDIHTMYNDDLSLVVPSYENIQR